MLLQKFKSLNILDRLFKPKIFKKNFKLVVVTL